MKKYFIYVFCIVFFSCYASDIAFVGLTLWDKYSSSQAKKRNKPFVDKNVTRKRRIQKVPVISKKQHKTTEYADDQGYDEYDDRYKKSSTKNQYRDDDYDYGYDEAPRKKAKKISDTTDHTYDDYDEAYDDSSYNQDYEKKLKHDESNDKRRYEKSDDYSFDENEMYPDDYVNEDI